MKNYFNFKLVFFGLLIFLAFAFRTHIFLACGNFLIFENENSFTETAFVLSGGAFDRGNKAAELFNNNKIGKIICTGANNPPNFKALNLNMLESALTRKNILQQISDTTKVTLLKKGTSTFEESEAILKYCIKNDIKECVVLSSKFHTRRIHKVFINKFQEQGITVHIIGSPSSSYNENKWWQSENGLIALNNEYIKLVYYFLFK